MEIIGIILFAYVVVFWIYKPYRQLKKQTECSFLEHLTGVADEN
jgi:hypothetical protein